MMRDGHPWHGSSYDTIPAANYAIGEMGKRSGAYEAVFSDDVEMFRPDRIRQFHAICFLNALRKSLLAYIARGNGFVGIHDAIATFVQYPKYDQWPPFGQRLGATENGGHPWDGETMTVNVEDPKIPLNAVFHGDEFQIADQPFQFQEPPFATISTCSSPLMWRRPVSRQAAPSCRSDLRQSSGCCLRPWRGGAGRYFRVPGLGCYNALRTA